MRDKLKSVEYFDEYIIRNNNRIKRFQTNIENGETKEERIIPVKAVIQDIKLQILLAKYSRGDEIEGLEKDFLELVSNWEEVWEPEYYNKNINIISLGVLFGVNIDFAQRAKELLNKSHIEDWLMFYLLDSLENKPIDHNMKILWHKYYTNLKRAVLEEDKDEKVNILKQYLKKNWYNSDCGCYAAHKSDLNIYYGYWSLEAGAVAKTLDIDDEILKDVKYYPYDLVHYKK